MTVLPDPVGQPEKLESMVFQANQGEKIASYTNAQTEALCRWFVGSPTVVSENPLSGDSLKNFNQWFFRRIKAKR